jgi:hypothetical protein
MESAGARRRIGGFILVPGCAGGWGASTSAFSRRERCARAHPLVGLPREIYLLRFASRRHATALAGAIRGLKAPGCGSSTPDELCQAAHRRDCTREFRV